MIREACYVLSISAETWNRMKLPEHPEQWTDYIRQWVRDHEVAGKVAILTEGPSSKHPETNYRMEIIELGR